VRAANAAGNLVINVADYSANSQTGTIHANGGFNPVYYVLVSSPYGLVSLDKLVGPLNWQITSASGINRSGEVIGNGTLNGVPTGFAATPF